jgi:DNA-binding LytR/AlgR family response regulator
MDFLARQLHRNSRRGGENFLLRKTMDGIEGKLDPQDFVRVRHSAILRFERIKELL